MHLVSPLPSAAFPLHFTCLLIIDCLVPASLAGRRGVGGILEVVQDKARWE